MSDSSDSHGGDAIDVSDRTKFAMPSSQSDFFDCVCCCRGLGLLRDY